MNIIEFARKAGFSTATVSRAFHEPDRVRPETRETILTLAESLCYYPSAIGRAMARGLHEVIGLVWPLEVEGADAVFAQRILAALTRQLVLKDLDLLICPVDRRNALAMAHAQRTFARSRCDGWILLYPRPRDPLVKSMLAANKPVICMMGEVPECPQWKTVCLSQRHWLQEALRMLRHAGSRNVLLFGCRPDEPDHQERRIAFLEMAPQYFDRAHAHLPCWPPTVEEITPILQKGSVDAIIGISDAAALCALQACNILGRKVPDQVQIIGMDDTPEAAASRPRLSTFRQPLDEMAAFAVDLVLGDQKRSKSFRASFVPGDTLRHKN